MPLYEYECQTCHKRTEKIQKFSDPEITICPHCGGPLQRVISAPAISFKGGGWYADGYASAKAPSSESKSGESKPAESAPAAAPASAPAAPAASTPAASSAPAKS
jgi:putative FmdB family regulatory protein